MSSALQLGFEALEASAARPDHAALLAKVVA